VLARGGEAITIWNFKKRAWNVGEFYFVGLVGTLLQLFDGMQQLYSEVA